MKLSEATSTTASLSVSPDRTIGIVTCPMFSSTEYTALEKLTVATKKKTCREHAGTISSVQSQATDYITYTEWEQAADLQGTRMS